MKPTREAAIAWRTIIGFYLLAALALWGLPHLRRLVAMIHGDITTALNGVE